MNIFANHNKFGGDFGKEFINNLRSSQALQIASGYFGASLLESLKPELLKVAARGHCKILIGMIFNEGVSRDQKNKLESLHNELTKINDESGVYISLSQYHGKIYRFTSQHEEKIYVGSSNFSNSGFKNNYEFNALITDRCTKDSVTGFLDYFFDTSKELSAKLNDVSLTVKGSKPVSTSGKATESLNNYLIPASRFPQTKHFSSLKIRLRVDAQPNSSLNLFFDKGRKNSSGKYSPRPWNEVEITTDVKDRLQNDYPLGEFDAYYHDKIHNKFYKIPMITASANFKAITSRGNREILGELIKGKLEELGHLTKFTRVTSETLDEYGRDFIELKKFSPNEYYLDF